MKKKIPDDYDLDNPEYDPYREEYEYPDDWKLALKMEKDYPSEK